MELFAFELPENTEPVDETRIQLVNLYFSQVEKARFNELCKRGMVALYGDKAKDANALDFLLDLLESTYGNKIAIPQGVNVDTAAIIRSLEAAKEAINEIEKRLNEKADSQKTNEG